MDNSKAIQQTREIRIFDIHARIEKRDIDMVLNQKYRVISSKIQKRLNVEFKTAAIAREVNGFLEDKELTYDNRLINFSLKGNRFLVEGMLDVPYEQVKNFFSAYGEVNNVYITKKYFATLASISQAVELVEKVGVLMIDGTRVEIKYAFDRNKELGNSSNKKFDIKVKDASSKFSSNTNLDKISTSQRPNIQLGEPITQVSNPIIVLGGSTGGNNLVPNGSFLNVNHGASQNGPAHFKNRNQENSRKNFYQQRHKLQSNGQSTFANGQPAGKHKAKKSQQQQKVMVSNLPNQTAIKMIPNPQPTVNKTEGQKSTQPKQQAALLSTPVLKPDVKVNSLKTNENLPLFAKSSQATGGLTTGAKGPIGFSSLNKLNYLDPDFKPTDYLENKTRGQVHTTTTYYSSNGNNVNKTGQLNLSNQMSNVTIGGDKNLSNPPRSNVSNGLSVSNPYSNRLNSPTSTPTKTTNNQSKMGSIASSQLSNIKPPDTTALPKNPQLVTSFKQSHATNSPNSSKSKKDENCVIC